MEKFDEAFKNIYYSACTILENKQRHLYCNVLDLLTTTLKTSGVDITNEEFINFLLNEILPLTTDEERGVQNGAIELMEEALTQLKSNDIHANEDWPRIKETIIKIYTPLVSELREKKNSNWHRIWSIYVRILDTELLRSNSVINALLSVVEIAFRSTDNLMRAEAFICWHALIKIFASHGELATPKRLKLICIPLKSSQPRTAQTAIVKYRCFWNLVTCLGNKIAENVTTVIEPFLNFTFGGGGVIAGVAQQYHQVRQLAIPCLLALLNNGPNEKLKYKLEDCNLDVLDHPVYLTASENLKNSWRPILNAILAAVKLLISTKGEEVNEEDEVDEEYLQILMQKLAIMLVNGNVAILGVDLCEALERIVGEKPNPVLIMFNKIATDKLVLQRDIIYDTDLKKFFAAFMKLCTKAKTHIPADILEQCVCSIFSNEVLHIEQHNDFRRLTQIANVVLKSDDDEDYNDFEVKLIIWRQITQMFIDYLLANELDCRLKQTAELLDQWRLWPLKSYASFAGRRTATVFEGNFCELWRKLVNLGQNAHSRTKFLEQVKSDLYELFMSHKEDPKFAELFEVYVAAVLKVGINKDEPIYKGIFELLSQIFVCDALPQKTAEGFLNTVRNAVNNMSKSDLSIIFEVIKPFVSLALQTWTKNKYEIGFLNDWKIALMDKLRKCQHKGYMKQLKEVYNNKTEFVVIPTVWCLNPEKLTERQKERFAEKAIIPALYNDMSQSQDSSIKAWTPKKVVIAKNNHTEIVLSGANEGAHDNTDVVIEETPNDNDMQRVQQQDNKAADVEEAPSTPTKQQKSPQKMRLLVNGTPRMTRLRSFQRDSVIEKFDTPEKKGNKTPSQQKINSVENSKMKENEKHKEALDDRAMNQQSEPQPEPQSEPEQKDSQQSESQQPEPTQSQPEQPELQETLPQSKQVTINVTRKPIDIIGVVKLDSIPLDRLTQMPASDFSTPSEITIPGQTDPIVAADIQEISAPKAPPEVTQLMVQEMSPKKVTPRFQALTVLQNSPPDRKLTNNSTSPTLRPKPTSLLTGRGAQLINMIRNKLHAPSLNRPQPVAAKNIIDRAETPARNMDTPDISNAEYTSTPLQPPKEMLVFCKRLPLPSASPSASILKRRVGYDSIDDSIESPASKRKRVSFHDPPVSVTKEYVRDINETKNKTNRCLLLEKSSSSATSGGNENKNSLKRRSRIESMLEIEKFTSTGATGDLQKETTVTPLKPSVTTPSRTRTSATIQTNTKTPVATPTRPATPFATTTRITTPTKATTPNGNVSVLQMKWNEKSNLSNQDNNKIIATEPIECIDIADSEEIDVQSPENNVPDPESALRIVLENYTMEAVLKEYQNKASSNPTKHIIDLTKYLSNQMSTKQKIKTNVLEVLSENHSKDFLDHAIQENLSTVVCDRLNLNSVLEYICSKSQINSNCRNNLLAQIPDIVKSTKNEDERLGFIKKIILECNLNDDDMFALIAHITHVRANRHTENVSKSLRSTISESAVDSSSNL